MAGVHRVQQGSRLRSAYLADDDTVGPVPKDRFEEFVEGNLAAMGIGLRFSRNDVGFADVQFGGVLDEQNALVFWNGISQHAQKRRFPPAIRMSCSSRTASINVAAWSSVSISTRIRSASDVLRGELSYRDERLWIDQRQVQVGSCAGHAGQSGPSQKLLFGRGLMDTWYATRGLMLFIESLNKIYYCPLFAQDELRVHPRLNLSLGLRWEVSPPPTEQHGNDAFTLLGTVSNSSSLSLAPPRSGQGTLCCNTSQLWSSFTIDGVVAESLG